MQFNTQQFNTSLFNDEELIGNLLVILLFESISSTDDQVNVPNKVLTETIILNDDLHGRISIKGLADVIRLADWLTIKRDTNQNRWFD